MKNFRILAGFMVVFLVAFLSLSAAAHAKVGDSGHKKGKKLPKHARVLQAQIDVNKASIENIELTPGLKGDTGAAGLQGPAGEDGTDGAQGIQGIQGPVGSAGPQGTNGDKGAPGTNGVDGVDGADGTDGQSIQGPQGEPGTSSWADGFGTVSTTGSVQIGKDTAECTGANEGTIRFNTVTKAFEGCDGSRWRSISFGPVLYAIGDTGPAGGVVFHITDGGLHGLEAAPEDQSFEAQWGCNGTEITGADGTAVGTGAQNTADILAGCSTSGIAARVADAYSLGGYDDWYLPSKEELNLLYQQRAFMGGFTNDYYWSSTEANFSNSAWMQYFFLDFQDFVPKDNAMGVRAVRAF